MIKFIHMKLIEFKHENESNRQQRFTILTFKLFED